MSRREAAARAAFFPTLVRARCAANDHAFHRGQPAGDTLLRAVAQSARRCFCLIVSFALTLRLIDSIERAARITLDGAVVSFSYRLRLYAMRYLVHVSCCGCFVICIRENIRND